MTAFPDLGPAVQTGDCSLLVSRCPLKLTRGAEELSLLRAPPGSPACEATYFFAASFSSRAFSTSANTWSASAFGTTEYSLGSRVYVPRPCVSERSVVEYANISAIG